MNIFGFDFSIYNTPSEVNLFVNMKKTNLHKCQVQFYLFDCCDIFPPLNTPPTGRLRFKI